jgi:FMN-dependent NADH-azoreductase
MSILQITTSLHGDNATSTQLASTIAEHLSGEVTLRDLGNNPIPHITGHGFDGFRLEASERDAVQAQTAALSDALIGELQSADTIVLGLPMYNFGIPSALKAWIDHVARAGVTFGYTSEGPEGYLKGKRLIVAATRGGRYAGTESDIQSAYIRQVFGFMGITEVEFVYAEGMASAGRDDAIEKAHQQIEALAA